MSRRRRAASFLFEPARFRNDPAVLAMTDSERGIYIMLLTAGWELPHPGIFPDDDKIMAQLAMTTVDNYGAAKAALKRAFDQEIRPGFWVQRGLARTFRAQTRFVSAQSERGRLGAKAKWGKDKDGTSTANGPPKPTSGSVIGSGSEKIEEKDFAHARGEPASTKKSTASDTEDSELTPPGPSWAWQPQRPAIAFPPDTANPAATGDVCDPASAHDAVAALQAQFDALDESAPGEIEEPKRGERGAF